MNALPLLIAGSAAAYYVVQRPRGLVVVTMNVDMSDLEKKISTDTEIHRKMKIVAGDIQKMLPSRCPGVPKLRGKPRVGIRDEASGYVVTIVWADRETHTSSGVLRAVVTNCILKIVRENKDIGDRVKSLTAVRLS